MRLFFAYVDSYVYSRIFYITVLLCLLCPLCFAHFAGGSGTEGDPWQIATTEHLDHIREYLGPEHSDKHFVQSADINLGIPPWNADEGWLPIGSYPPEERFRGSFDGDEYTIYNLTIDREGDYQGLFGYIQNAHIKNVILQDINISGNMYIGGLTGFLNDSRIENCTVTGTIESRVSLNSHAGGLVGQQKNGTSESNIILDSYANVNITGANITGGLVGFHQQGSIIGSRSLGDVRGRTYVGGLAGYSRSIIKESSAKGNVSATGTCVGGLVGSGSNEKRVVNSFARGEVYGDARVGGLIGHNLGEISNSYSTGAVLGGASTGGLIGENEGNIENSYWDIQRSGMGESDGGFGRLTRHMTYPYAQHTFSDWDFDDVWVSDVNSDVNDGYPFSLRIVEPSIYPDIAYTPSPQHQSTNVSLEVDSLAWRYSPSVFYSEPAGFRVYLNTTGDFHEDDSYVWIEYNDSQKQYAARDIGSQLEYATTYFWKVVPTTSGSSRNNGLGESGSRQALINRNDAQDVPIWRFTTEIYPYPNNASHPNPEDFESEIPVRLNELGWRYIDDFNHVLPQGFRVYFNNTGEFDDEDDFTWVPFVHSQIEYSCINFSEQDLDYDTQYFWKVIPTTRMPDDRLSQNEEQSNNRNDAVDYRIWRFRTLSKDNKPQAAVNPDPENHAEGVSIDLQKVGWEYHSSEFHPDPLGFRIYLNTTGMFGDNAPYIWVDYDPDAKRFSTANVIPAPLDESTNYFWKVVPTTEHPDNSISDAIDKKNRVLTAERDIQAPNKRHVKNRPKKTDAPNIPIWRFTTAATTSCTKLNKPPMTKLIGNFPNPFNPDTIIELNIEKKTNADISIYDLKGRLIKTIHNGLLKAGEHRVHWNGKDYSGRNVSSGIYFYQLKTDDGFRQVNKMLLLE